MKYLSKVESLSDVELPAQNLAELLCGLSDELCMDEDPQTNNELFMRYIKAYDRIQEVMARSSEEN